MIPSFPVYLFDVDGTLMDSAADICAAQHEVFAARGVTGLSDTFLRGYIGKHLIDLFQDVGFPPDDVTEMVEHYRAVYTARKHADTLVYPGVPEMLARLGGRKATATTKGTNSTRVILEQFGLIQHFDHVQGTDGFPAKPDPDVILAALKALGSEPGQCLLVGDSPSDMEAGRRAGVKLCAVRWGYGAAEEMARWEPDFWIAEPGELIGITSRA